MYQRWWLPGLAFVLASALFLTMSLSVRAQPPPPTSMSKDIDVEALEPHMTTGTCKDGTQASGAVYRICMPGGANPPWNGDLVVYAHGYVAFYKDVGIPEDQMSLPGALFSVDEIVNGLGYAFAATSYYTNGLAVRPALSDLLDLVDVFSDTHGSPGTVLLTGVSEGGLITTLAVENYPDVFDGGLAMCGPYGSFNRQVSHYGDFRVIFDYFFPGLMPGEPVTIPNSLIEDWETSYYTDTILPVITHLDNAPKIDQLLQVTGAAPYAFDPPTSTNSIERLLWYNVYATMDGRSKLGGQPYGNASRTYRGANDDTALNASVWRTSADPAALEEIDRYYDPTGVLTSPLVTLHTTGDFLVPYDTVALYRGKVMRADNLALHEHFEVERYGHCSFELLEILEAFNTLVDMVDTPPPYQPVYKTYLPLVLRTP
jgi:pimeloyl-ACP methyl ester carboxylesterase